MRLNRIFEWKVMTIWISRDLLLFNSEHLDISWASIIHSFKKLWPFQFAESFLVQIRLTRYIIVVNWTSDSKVIAVWIRPVLPSLISSVSIYYVPESDIRVKSYDRLIFPRASVVQFWVSRYIMGLNHTHPSQHIWSFEFAQSIHVQIRASRYIIGLNWSSESKVMVFEFSLHFHV